MEKPLTPTQRESLKTQQEQAEDIAYTINHSLACTLTDFINPVVNTFTEGKIKGLGGCGHDHSGDHAHDHYHHDRPATGSWWQRTKQAMGASFNKQRFINWAKGEFLGDFGAVPLTIATQRLFPGFMNGVRRVIEPVAKPFFRSGAERAAKRWAAANNVAPDGTAAKEQAGRIYEHEMSHLPQAAMWTAFSLAINVAYQKYKDKARPLTRLLASAASGMAVTAGLVVGARAVAPDKVRRFDQFTSKNLLLPATRTVGSVFGVSVTDVERMAERQWQLEQTGWQEKDAARSPAAATSR